MPRSSLTNAKKWKDKKISVPMIEPDYSGSYWDKKPIYKNILWTSDDGVYVVVKGKVPSGFPRTTNRPTKNMAIINYESIMARLGHSAIEKFIKTYAKHIIELKQFTETGEEICP